MHIGVTGTRKGMSVEQKAVAIKLLRGQFVVPSPKPDSLHHGDCVGVDAELANLAQAHDIEVVGYPPIKHTLRAYFRSNVTHSPQDNPDRNRAIVDASTIVWAFPDGPERNRSGTWYTIKYAQQIRRPLLIVMPNGVVEVFTGKSDSL